MKRLTMIVALSVMMVLPALAERVTPETARKVATTFLNNNGAKNIQLTDLSKDAGFPNLYIFTTESSFVVMSADDCVKPILGYSLTGAFVTEDTPENISSWLQGYNDGIQYAIENRVKSTIKTKREWDELANGKPGVSQAIPVVDALVKTKWNQGSPYNNQCPKIGNTRTVTGCVATAMAQVMKFWEHPITGTDSTSYTWNNQTLSANFGKTTYDWNSMTNTYNNSSTNSQKVAVATLMYHCGVSIEMNYGTSASSASTYDVIYALQTYFNYASCMEYKSKNDYSDGAWIIMLKRELNDGKPLQYRGSDAGGEGGHSFVCDGYDTDDNFHFNWGWGGYCDGYYSINNMNPNPDASATGAGNGIYTIGQSAIFGIEPISSLTAPTLSASVNQNVVTLTWNPIEGASSYDVYKDNEKIGTGLTSTTYVDNDIEFGVYYDYHVRAVSSTTRSNPSNRVTKCSFYRDFTPSNLTVAYENSNAELTWEAEGLSTDLHYGMIISNYLYGTDASEDAYWGHRYLSSTLTQLMGMTITKVSSCFYFAGSYTMYLYSGNLDENTRTKLAEKAITKSNNSLEWIDFTLDNPIDIDCTKDLWAIIFTDNSIAFPIPFEIDYFQDNANDARFLSTTLDDIFSSESIIEDDNVSWLIRTYLTDGTYTYNLYDNGTSIASDLSETSYTVTNPATNTAHQYTVKTKYYGGESNASNMAGLAIGTASLSTLTLNATDKMTVTEGSQLTVEGSLIDDNADNLILENGAQLVNNSTDVQATVKKDIAAYTAGERDGWYLIASPILEGITPTVDNGLLTNDYDLYLFDQSEELEWRNYKTNPKPFTSIENKTGYLYANSDNPTLVFSGTLAANVGSITLTYDDNASFKGFNLIGNPYPCETYVIGRSFYIVQKNATTHQSEFILGDNPVPPCTAILVQTTAEEVTEETNTVTFSKTAPTTPGKSIDISVTKANQKGNAILDKTRVSFDESDRLLKYNLNENSSRLYIPMGGQDLAVAYANGEKEMPINFKTAENGTFTLAIEIEDLDLDYLHLIDNMTGDDVDLLNTPSYTFEAKTTDYTSRFRLVFSNCEDAVGDNETFAYVNNGEIVIMDVETFQETSLQVVDMMGRVIASHCGRMRCVPTTGMTAGVYVLRLITGDNMKTQKIVIE